MTTDRTGMLVPLTRGQWAVVDASDYERVNRLRWQYRPGRSDHHTGYAARGTTRDGKTVSQYMHHVLMADELQPGQQADHRDGNGLDNRRTNLRAATRSQQTANTRGHSRSGYKGVSWYTTNGRWIARVYVQGKSRYRGQFELAEDAARAYDAAALEAWGSFARLNFPPVAA